MIVLYVTMIVVFLLLVFNRDRWLLEVLNFGVRMTPLAFLLVSMYFESRFEFYDLVIKRGVILVLSLVLLGATFAATLQLLDQMPATIARPWLFAVVLLPLAMVLPWLHQRTSRLLDRLWLGREFTPVEAVKHVLGVMQQATDEPSLVSASASTLSEMFRRRVLILLDDQPLPEIEAGIAEVAVTSSPNRIRLAVVNEPGARPLLSEDLAMLRSLDQRLRLHARERAAAAQTPGAGTSRAGAPAADQPLGAQGAARADQPALPVQRAQRHRLADPYRSGRAPMPPSNNSPRSSATRCAARIRNGRRSIRSWPLRARISTSNRRASAGASSSPSTPIRRSPARRCRRWCSRRWSRTRSSTASRASRMPGRIDVRARAHGNRVTLEVRDTGPGLDASPHHPSAEGESFGLRSVRERLSGYFGADATLDLVREHETTVARIHLPFVEQTSPVVGALR